MKTGSIVVILAVSLGGLVRAADLRIGVASVTITPPTGVPMAGYYRVRLAGGVHDDLHAKSIVLEVGDTRAALVALDLITTTHWLVEEARSAIAASTGIPCENVMISATHAHTGPVLVDGSDRTAALGGTNEAAVSYSRSLPALIAHSVELASSRLDIASPSSALGNEPTLAFNRRFHMSDGTVGWNPGKGNPGILGPVGPIDPSVPVIMFRSPEGSPLAVYINHALHLDTVGGLEISADFPYSLSEVLSRVLGPRVLTMFTNGCAGDLNHIDVSWPAPQKGHAEAERIGCVLAGAVLRTLPRLKTLGKGPLQCLSETVELPLPVVTGEAVARARSVRERRARGERIPFLELVEAYKVLDVAAREGRPHEVEVQVITLGTGVAWVALPGEVFVQLGLAIKAASPFGVTAVAELSNGSIGYIPTRQAYTQGNYEVVSARCGIGSGERLVEAACRLLRRAHRAVANGEQSP